MQASVNLLAALSKLISDCMRTSLDIEKVGLGIGHPDLRDTHASCEDSLLS